MKKVIEYHRGEIDEDMFNEWFNEYKKIGGSFNKEIYAYFLNVFIASTVNAYTGGDVFTRDECLTRWNKFINNKKEASLIFRSVDNITPYS